MAFNDISSQMKSVKTLYQRGELIDRITETEFFEVYEKDEITIQNLLPCFEGKTNKRVFFARNESEYDTKYYVQVDDHLVLRGRFPLTSELRAYAQPAMFGDVLAQETRIDPSVRKGFDVKIDGKNVQVTEHTIEMLTRVFKKTTGIDNVYIVPYKINIYKEGDFFSPHRDSPESGLLATLIWHIEGQKNKMIIDGESWQEGNNIAIFFPDVIHEVKPVDRYRETISFKVFASQRSMFNQTFENPIFNSLAKKLPNDEHGVLLQNGYMLSDYENFSALKGIDRNLYDFYLANGRKIRMVPVIVYAVTKADEEGGDAFCKNPNQFILADDTGSGDEDVSEKKSKDVEKYLQISIYNMKTNKDLVPRMTVYLLGKGFQVGEYHRRNEYIGNEYGGSLEENVYVNVMFVVE